MTSFAGLVIFQKLFEVLGLAQGLRDCTSKLDSGSTRLYNFGTALNCLIVHLVLVTPVTARCPAHPPFCRERRDP